MKNYIQQLKGITIATVFFFGLLYVQAWTGAPAGTPPANNVDAPVNVGTDWQVKSGPLGIMGVIRAYSNLSVDGALTASGTFKIPNGSGNGKVLKSDATGNASWATVSSLGIVTTESDPTVIASVKDGVSWTEVTGKPTVISSITGGPCLVGQVVQSISSTGVVTCGVDAGGSAISGSVVAGCGGVYQVGGGFIPSGNLGKTQCWGGAVPYSCPSGTTQFAMLTAYNNTNYDGICVTGTNNCGPTYICIKN